MYKVSIKYQIPIPTFPLHNSQNDLLSWDCRPKYIQHAGTSLVPDRRRELCSVRDDQVLQTVGPGAGQLLVVLLHAPVELIVQFSEQHRAQDLVVLGEDIHDGIQRVVTRGRHPLGLL